MASPIPNIYRGLVPTQTEGGLTPLQLAAADFLIQYTRTGQNSPFFINQAFLSAMRTFIDSGMITPSGVNPYTGQQQYPIIAPGITGIRFIMVGDDVYLYRRAQDCGPDEDRYEKIYIGKKSQVAEGTFAYYGREIWGGSQADGAITGGYG